jgi:hypothetical protein
MTEEIQTPTQATAKPAAKKEKKPTLEDKPFQEFITQDFIPSLQQALAGEGVKDINLSFTEKSLPILTGANPSDQCWQIIGDWPSAKREFNLYFLDSNIQGKKAFSYSVSGKPPSTIESFMIDEKKVTLDLIVLYTIQRLNSQKWLKGN